MPLPAPLLVEGVVRVAPARLAPALAALVAAIFLVERLAGLDLLGERAARLAADLGAAARLYHDGALWGFWQPWSAALLADGWWGLAAIAWALLVPGRALERAYGAAALALLALMAAAAGSLVHLALAGAVASQPGCDPLGLGLAAAATAALPGARLRWGVAWYAVLSLGWRPLWAMPLAAGAGLYLLQAGLHALAGGDPLAGAAGLLAAAAAGIAGGMALAHRR